MTERWIFFDCFNTLIDDFDVDGDETGMKPLGRVAAEFGWCEEPEEFHQAYLRWRKETWTGEHWQEVHLRTRLAEVLQSGRKGIHIPFEHLLDKLMDEFQRSFPPTVRPAPGVMEMLDRLHHRIRMGVVSNFFIPGMPKELLTQLGLHHYFDFILDSAQLGSKKPDNRIYEEALRQAGLTGANGSVIFIGDHLLNDYQMPRSLGFASVFFDRSKERPSPPAGEDVIHIRHWHEFDPANYWSLY